MYENLKTLFQSVIGAGHIYAKQNTGPEKEDYVNLT